MSRARDLSKLGNPNVIVADTERVGFGTQVPENPANAASSLISAGIVTAAQFFGDGSNLEGVASAGLGTAVDDTKDSIGQNIYFTNAELSINENTTVNAPDTSNIAYTQYQQVTVESGSELIIADGDSFIPDVLGIGTALQASTAGAGNGLFGTIFVDNIENAAGRGGPNFPLGITVAGVSTLSGNVSIGGTLTYEDVTNVDSVGVVTARSGIDINAGGLDITAGGANIVGVSTLGGNLNINGTDNNNTITLKNTTASDSPETRRSKIIFQGTRSGGEVTDLVHLYGQHDGGNDNDWGAFRVLVNNGSGVTERFGVGQGGEIRINASIGSAGQVLTSQGGGAAPQWATPSGGSWEVVSTHVLSGSTSYIDSNGWSNSYVQYQVVYNDIYYSNTDFKIHLRVYKDSTSGNAGTLKTASQYAFGSTQEEQWSSGAVQRSGYWSNYHKLANASNQKFYNGFQTFPMQTFNGGGNVYSGWYGRTNCGGALYNTDGGLYNTDKTEFLTGMRMFFFATDGSTPINPSNGRVTILRMKYS